jgi:hypothetical protein
MRSAILPLIIGLAACSDVTTPKDQPNPVAATYSQYAIDGHQIPTATPADTCESVNMGGWLSLTAEGTYSMVLDRTSRMCGGVPSGSNYLSQRGTYQLADDVVTFFPTPPYGPAFAATFDPGNYQPGQGGRVRNLKFSFVGHDYWVIEEVPALGSRP